MDRPGRESGRNGLHSCPLFRVAVDARTNLIMGHIDLKGSPLKTGSHHCELGMGDVVKDRFRINASSIDDVLMPLKVKV